MNPGSRCVRRYRGVRFYQNAELRRSHLPHDIDGLVYKVNDLSLQKRRVRKRGLQGLLPVMSQQNTSDNHSGNP